MKKKYDYLKDEHRSISSDESSIAFGFQNFDHGAAIFAGESPDYAYHGLGYGNPIVREFEVKMTEGEAGDLEGFDALATASGMSALDILTRYMCLGEDGKNEVVVSPKIYGGSHVYFSKLAPAMGIKCHFVDDPHSLADWNSYINEKTAFLFLETPGNPTADIFSIPAFANLARSRFVPLVVDNTVATHALQRPLALGADMVLVSASKGINGHSTGLGGVIVAREDLVTDMRDTWGVGVRAVMDPMGARRMLAGLETLKERMMMHSMNAFCIAQYLNALPRIESVRYPSLRVPSFDYQRQADEQMDGGGPMFGVTIKGNLEDTRFFIDTLTSTGVVIQAPHICHTKTLAIHPASTTHARVLEEDREKLGITDTFIRVSAGIEIGADFSHVMCAFSNAHEALVTRR